MAQQKSSFEYYI